MTDPHDRFLRATQQFAAQAASFAAMTPLPCGCVRGSYLCPTAERLWRDSNNAWTAGDYSEYARLRKEYEAHFYQPAPANEQETPHV